MPADEASEGQPPENGEGRGDSGDERPGSRRDGSVPILEELFRGEDRGSTPARRSS